MKRLSVVLGALLGGGLVSLCAVAVVGTVLEREQIFSLKEVRVGLMRDPAAWLHRTIRLRAVAEQRRCLIWAGPPSDTCQLWGRALVGADGTGPAAPLPFGWGGAPALERVLGQVPMAAWAAPAPQTVTWGVPNVYQIRLEEGPCPLPGAGICVHAIVLGAR